MTRRNSTLQQLYLGANSIGEEGAMAVAEALQRNTTLQTIDLQANRRQN